MLDPKKPYYGLPLLPPESELETVPVLKALVEAAAALAELDATALSLPNPSILYENIILMEAKDSSEIENIVTTNETLFLSQHMPDAGDPMTKEINNYAHAIRQGWQSKKPISTNLMEELCTTIKGKSMQVRKLPGTVLSNGSEVIYTPPDGETLLRDMLDNLFQWMNEEDELNPILKTAIAHYQFESIHPFYDGNGRVGRMMIVLYLVEQDVLTAPILFMSDAILKDRSSYYKMLQSARESNEFDAYLMWFLAVTTLATNTSINRALRVKQAMLEMKHIVRDTNPKIYSQDLINCLFIQPFVFADSLLAARIVGTRQTAHNYLSKLEDMGVIKRYERKIGRHVCWINISLLDAINADLET